MAAEVGGLGEGSMGVGVAMDVFFGVEPEFGLAALGVAILSRTIDLLLSTLPS
jgi:hypothetical protein